MMACFSLYVPMFACRGGKTATGFAGRQPICWAALHGLVSLLLARPSFPWKKRNHLIAFHINRVFARVARKRSVK